MKKIFHVITTTLIFCLLLLSCANNETKRERENKTRVWTDDTGRNVEIKANITRIAVSGRIAQSVVYPLAKDMLVGIAEPWSEYEKTIIKEPYSSLPVHGRIYGTKGKVNLETLISLSPDVVIDIGTNMSGIKDDMDSFTVKTGIPFIHITLDKLNLDDVYTKLGILLNREENAKEIAEFTKKVYSYADETLKKTTPKKVLFLTGPRAERVIADGSYFSSALDLCVDNRAKFDTIERMSYAPFYTSEQLLLFNPDVVIFSSVADKNEILHSAPIQALEAVQNSNVFYFPHIPYENMGFPPGPTEIFGILWLLNTLYKSDITFSYDDEIRLFYKYFFNVIIDN